MKLRYILIASLFCLVAGIVVIGQSANTSQKLAQKLLGADNARQSLDAPKAELESYVQAHMGSSITVFLAASYNAAVVAATTSPSGAGQVYQDAQAACTSRTTAVVQSNCVQNYLNSHPVIAAPATPTIAKDPYTLNYTAPRWTPDLAGILLALAGVGLLMCGGMWLGRAPFGTRLGRRR